MTDETIERAVEACVHAFQGAGAMPADPSRWVSQDLHDRGILPMRLRCGCHEVVAVELTFRREPGRLRIEVEYVKRPVNHTSH